MKKNALLILTILLSCRIAPQKTATVKSVMDDVVTRLYATLESSELNGIDDSFMQNFITPQERNILATKYWTFDANVPVTVSVMRHKDQRVVPYWLQEKFQKTDLVVANEEYEYEVWQNNFDAGRIELGFNGFDKHRPHYFVAVGPQNKSDNVVLSNFFPPNQHIETMDIGAFTYHDWDELVLTRVPEELRGQHLLTTIRGRAREAHVIGAFRATAYPASEKPDQILLTWDDDPQTTQTIQWRTNQSVQKSSVRYWPIGADSTNYAEQDAQKTIIEDRLLYNDRFIHRFSTTLQGLKPGTTYNYTIGSSQANAWSRSEQFKTAPPSPAPFSFIYFGDTHYSTHWGELVNAAFERHPKTAFFTIAGDVVSTGLYRNEWDQLFDLSKNVINHRPLMPSLGNHDNQDGLGPGLFLDLFNLPKNGPTGLKERAYSFEYSNALFLILDATGPIEEQTPWLETQLEKSRAQWKFAIFHFPPYSYEEDYPVIREQWGSLFDEHHVDFVMSGHVHYYMRSKPMYAQKPVASAADGTIYLISISIPNRERGMPAREWVDVRFGGEGLYQTFDIDGDKLVYRAMNIDGDVRDELVVEK